MVLLDCSFERLPMVEPKPGKVGDVLELVNFLYESSSFNGRRIAEACQLYERMIRSDATVCLTLAGAVTPTGLGGIICTSIESGLVDFVISTGANLYHDLHFALDLPVYKGDFRVDDRELFRKGVVRIYDIFIPVETLLQTDKFIRDVFKDVRRVASTAEVHRLLGEKLLNMGVKAGKSILTTAFKYDVPVYTPSPADSSIGMNLAQLKLQGGGLVIDPDLDLLETTAIVYGSSLNGVVVLGGGAPKNFYMQTQPTLSQVLGVKKGGHDFFIQICVDPEHYGGLSGATHNEAVSWGKINPNKVGNGVVVYCDLTLATPILFGYLLSKGLSRKHKRLYIKREELLLNLKGAVHQT